MNPLSRQKWKMSQIMLMGIIIFLTSARFWMGCNASYWIRPDGPHDDGLFINYCNPFTHNFTGTLTHSPNMLLIKESSYSLFLDAVYVSHLSYGLMLTIVYFCSALLMWHLANLLTKNRAICIGTYLYVLFHPAAFDSWLGTRIYRNAIIAPFVYIVLALMICAALRLVRGEKKQMMLYNIPLMILLPFTCFIKEDGSWLIAVFSVAIVLEILYLACDMVITRSIQGKSIIAWCIILILPFAGFLIYKKGLEAFNKKYFGVALTNSRTQGELARFVNLSYKIKSDDRTPAVWAPKDALDKAYHASETFSAHPELYDHIIHTPWFAGDIRKHPITRDFLTWVLRDAVASSGLWESEQSVQDLFRNINDELEAAFLDKRLTRETKIQLVSSMGGRTFSEILALTFDIVYIYNTHLSLRGYELKLEQSHYVPQMSEKAELILHTQLASPGKIQKKVLQMAKKLPMPYAIINWFLLFVTIATVFCGVRNLIKKRTDQCRNFVLLCQTALIGISLAYALAVAWFCTFLTGDNHWLVLKFYSPGIIPILSLLGVCSLGVLSEDIGKMSVKSRIAKIRA